MAVKYDAPLHADVVAREVVGTFIARSGELPVFLAREAMRQIDAALVSGALPGEVGFFYEIGVKAYLR